MVLLAIYTLNIFHPGFLLRADKWASTLEMSQRLPGIYGNESYERTAVALPEQAYKDPYARSVRHV